MNNVLNKIIVIAMLFCGIVSTYSQTDSLFLKNYEQKILENSKLKSVLQREKQNFSDLNDAYKKDTFALYKQIKVLKKDVETEKQKVSDLNKNKVKTERDILLYKVDSMNIVISTLYKTISDKDKQTATIKISGEQKAREEKEKGKSEAFENIVNSYKNRPFDDLINFSTKESVGRDIQLVGGNLEIKQVLNDLQIYFNALALFSEKFDVVKIKKTQTQLNQIQSQSKLLVTLKDDVGFYQDFNSAFKEMVLRLINLDQRKSAFGDTEIQKLKFNEIVTVITDFIYNYYDYVKYPYLSITVIEIIKRKRLNADADITDLLRKL